MSCRKVTRELIEAFRFGELDQRSAAHLEHLEVCEACRTEVGLDQLLVRNLRRALAARLESYAPSPGAWQGVLRRATADAEQPSLSRLMTFARAARTLAAGSAIALAVILTQGGIDGLEVSTSAPPLRSTAATLEREEWPSLPPQPMVEPTTVLHHSPIPAEPAPKAAGNTPYAEMVMVIQIGTPPAYPNDGGVIQ